MGSGTPWLAVLAGAHLRFSQCSARALGHRRRARLQPRSRFLLFGQARGGLGAPLGQLAGAVGVRELQAFLRRRSRPELPGTGVQGRPGGWGDAPSNVGQI